MTREELIKETPFTPGPWEVNTFAGRPYREVFSGNQGLCDCGIYGQEAQEIEANARLIAAAPEMYEALFKLRGAVDGILLEYEYLTECKALALAALAKVYNVFMTGN